MFSIYSSTNTPNEVNAQPTDLIEPQNNAENIIRKVEEFSRKIAQADRLHCNIEKKELAGAVARFLEESTSIIERRSVGVALLNACVGCNPSTHEAIIAGMMQNTRYQFVDFINIFQKFNSCYKFYDQLADQMIGLWVQQQHIKPSEIFRLLGRESIGDKDMPRPSEQLQENDAAFMVFMPKELKLKLLDAVVKHCLPLQTSRAFLKLLIHHNKLKPLVPDITHGLIMSNFFSSPLRFNYMKGELLNFLSDPKLSENGLDEVKIVAAKILLEGEYYFAGAEEIVRSPVDLKQFVDVTDEDTLIYLMKNDIQIRNKIESYLKAEYPGKRYARIILSQVNPAPNPPKVLTDINNPPKYLERYF